MCEGPEKKIPRWLAEPSLEVKKKMQRFETSTGQSNALVKILTCVNKIKVAMAESLQS